MAGCRGRNGQSWRVRLHARQARTGTLFIAVLAAAATLIISAGPAAAAQPASYRSCGPAIKHSRFGQVYRIRVTTGFPCRSARDRLRRWLADGASYQGMAPWTCNLPYRKLDTYRDLNRCRLRTSFGGTKPLRTYRLGFIYSIRS